MKIRRNDIIARVHPLNNLQQFPRAPAPLPWRFDDVEGREVKDRFDRFDHERDGRVSDFDDRLENRFMQMPFSRAHQQTSVNLATVGINRRLPSIPSPAWTQEGQRRHVEFLKSQPFVRNDNLPSAVHLNRPAAQSPSFHDARFPTLPDTAGIQNDLGIPGPLQRNMHSGGVLGGAPQGTTNSQTFFDDLTNFGQPNNFGISDSTHDSFTSKTVSNHFISHQSFDTANTIPHSDHLLHVGKTGLVDTGRDFIDVNSVDGFVVDNTRSVADMIPKAEPVFKPQKEDGFEQDGFFDEQDGLIDNTLEIENKDHELNMENPIEGLELLGNSKWEDILKELASVEAQGAVSTANLPGEPVVVYPVNPHPGVENGKIGIPGEGIVLFPVGPHSIDLGAETAKSVEPKFKSSLDQRPHGLGPDAFNLLGIDPSSIDHLYEPVPNREIVGKAITADKIPAKAIESPLALPNIPVQDTKDNDLAPEHPPPIPLPVIKDHVKRMDAGLTHKSLITESKTNILHKPTDSSQYFTNIGLNDMSKNKNNVAVVSPAVTNDQQGISLIKTLIAAEAIAETLDEIQAH